MEGGRGTNVVFCLLVSLSRWEVSPEKNWLCSGGTAAGKMANREELTFRLYSLNKIVVVFFTSTYTVLERKNSSSESVLFFTR